MRRTKGPVARPARTVRSTVTRCCYAVLDALRQQGPDEDACAAWDGAVEAALRAGSASMDADETCLYAFTGWSFHTARCDHRAAADILNRFFVLPASERLDAMARRLQRCNLASSLLRAGDVEQACSLYDAVLGGALRGEARAALHRGRDQVVCALEEVPAGVVVPGCLRDLAIHLARRLGQRTGLAALSRRAASAGELVAMLRSTYHLSASK